uniref:Kazal-like domain-containing protein n=1 Tax=Setaria digitata TaxID=48799 RepID=A0A915Q4Z9_9BILA
MERSGKRNVADINRNVSETCQHVMIICNDEPKSMIPVCDNTNQTHRSPCSLALFSCRESSFHPVHSRILVHVGPCNIKSPVFTFEEEVCPSRCSGKSKPVCDTRQQTYRNLCIFQRRNLNVLSPRTAMACDSLYATAMAIGIASASRSCYRQCPDNLTYDPICATTFVTYPNRCLFLNAKCRDKSLEQLYYGECRDCLTSNCNGTAREEESDSNFVCDQAGQTKRKCEFEMLRCIYERKFGYNITIAYTGRCCPTEETCRLLADEKAKIESEGPVCDSRNVTHRNRCRFEVYKCRAEKIAHLKITLLNENGSCTGVAHVKSFSEDMEGETKCDSVVECDERYDPVCGTDGITYLNRCRFIKTKCHDNSLLMAYKGECCTNKCEQHWAPVCDNRNVTHLNLCTFSMHNCTAARRDQQPLSIVSYTACTTEACSMECKQDDDQPVCGSNGVTYRNECELNIAICGLKQQVDRWNLERNEEMKLELDYKGKCCEDITAKCDNTASSSAVCDSEGHTHINICEYERAACLSRKRFRTNLTIRYWGECCVDNCHEEQVGTKLCDDAETTHESWCKFRLAKCELHRRNNRTLQVAYMGECCKISHDEKCANSGPVCDSDGITHINLCIFRHKQCLMNRTKNKLIKIAYHGKSNITLMLTECQQKADLEVPGTAIRSRL